MKIVTSYYPTPAYGGGRIVYIEPVFKLNDYNIYYAKVGGNVPVLGLNIKLFFNNAVIDFRSYGIYNGIEQCENTDNYSRSDENKRCVRHCQ